MGKKNMRCKMLLRLPLGMSSGPKTIQTAAPQPTQRSSHGHLFLAARRAPLLLPLLHSFPAVQRGGAAPAAEGTVPSHPGH